MHLFFDSVRYSPNATSTDVILLYFSVADVKCGLYEISKDNSTIAMRGPSPVQKMSRDQTEAMLDLS